MKNWNEVEIDAFSYFQWFNKEEACERTGEIPKLSVFSVNGSELLGLSDKIAFKDLCSSVIQEMFANQNFLKDYKLYLFANVEVKDKISRIERYRKVWKLLETKWQINTFIKGPEIEVELDGKLFFSSIANFGYESFSTVLDIVSNNSKKCAIIASKKDGILSEKAITDIFNLAFNQYRRYMDEIDYFGLSIHLCPGDDMIFRWGDMSEEAEIALIFKSDMFTLFNDLL